jgi:hypothetical protein
MPQIENVTQIILGRLKGGCPHGVNYATKTSGNTGIHAPVAKGNEKREDDAAERVY